MDNFIFLLFRNMARELNLDAIQELYDAVYLNGIEKWVYLWVDVGKFILDIWVTLQESEFKIYLWSIDNAIIWFKQVENIIKNLIIMWISENNIFFWTENTWIYGHDIMNYFDDRIPNTYILNSNLTCHARQYYAKSDSKSDDIDAVIVAITLRDLDNKNMLESIKNPYKKNGQLWFVRRSFSNERNSLRILFRRLSTLRCQKSKLMTSINMTKNRLFPEINGIFSIKHRASCENLLLNNFSRNEMLSMTKNEFIEKYKSLSTKWQKYAKTIEKVEKFYDRVKERWEKQSRSDLDKLTWKDSDSYLLEEIKFKLQHYELTTAEMQSVSQKISEILEKLQKEWCFIPSFKWINDIEIWLILWEIWTDIYQMSSKEFIGFVWWYPDNYTSWGGHMVKASKMSYKKWIIKKFIYVWMYGFQLHNPSFRLYKKLLTLLYLWEEWNNSVISLKTKRKIEIKCWEKLLKIIHNSYKNQTSFDESKFIETTIIPLINRLQEIWLNNEIINACIIETYKNKQIPINLQL